MKFVKTNILKFKNAFICLQNIDSEGVVFLFHPAAKLSKFCIGEIQHCKFTSLGVPSYYDWFHST